MPVCGSCGQPVANSDIICPHCGVLLAAYASPAGSGASTDYAPPPEPPTAEIPAVDLNVPPPSETPVVTNPDEVAEEAISTAPRPLFDTNLTVEAIAKAADGDHDEDLVTIKDTDIQTKTVMFDVPAYARPPANAAPIPVVEDAEDINVPLIRQDPSVAETRTADSGDETEDGSDSDPDPGAAGESWLNASFSAQPRPVTAPASKKKKAADSRSKRQPTSPPAAEVGRTDAYLRKLHEEAGYTPNQVVVSQPVEESTATPPKWDPNRRMRERRRARDTKEVAAASESMRTGCLGLYFIALFVIWTAVIFSIVNGNFSPVLIFIALVLAFGHRHIDRIIHQVSNS